MSSLQSVCIQIHSNHEWTVILEQWALPLAVLPTERCLNCRWNISCVRRTRHTDLPPKKQATHLLRTANPADFQFLQFSGSVMMNRTMHRNVAWSLRNLVCRCTVSGAKTSWEGNTGVEYFYNFFKFSWFFPVSKWIRTKMMPPTRTYGVTYSGVFFCTGGNQVDND